MNILTCKDVSMKYNTSFAVKQVGFDLNQGDYLCIVGENGSGKTTLMKGILGLMKPISGQVIFNKIKQTQIGYLPQQTIIQKDFPASVFEVVLSGCLNKRRVIPIYLKKDKDLAISNMRRLDVEKLIDKPYRDLSYGQQQRVLLARALCASEKLLILDEPVTGLDPIMTKEMYDLLYRLNKEVGITIIMISHDIKNAVKYGNKILHMQNSLLFFGLTEEYMKTSIGHRMFGNSVALTDDVMIGGKNDD